MSLKEYHAKRDFQQTPEPEGEKQESGHGSLRFVVQKHKASHLHYDFRLELDGVLKSWAVPKGPSMNPDEKKLAMMVEDHPLDYEEFEGIIPEGEYGGGTVMLWDMGTYHAPGINGRAENERVLKRDLARGRLKFILEGEKLKGEFNLVKLKDQKGKGNSWLLIKGKDEYAGTEDILKKDKSVKSQQSLTEIQENEQSEEWHSKGHKDSSFIDLEKLDLSGARRGHRPEEVEPMLATLAEEPFDKAGWIFELKWDGFRAIADTGPGKARLYSRNNIDYEAEFSPLVKELSKLNFNAVMDGEIVVVDEEGRAQFRLLQNYRTTGKGLLVYYIFDLLYLEGYDLRSLPLFRRKEILKEVLPNLPRIKYSDHLEEQGIEFFRLAIKNGLEGIVAKDKYSHYRPGVRSREWLKIKTHLRQEAVIGGFTQPRGSRSNLGALLLGVYDGKDLVYVGHTGGGFHEAELVEVRSRLEPLVRKEPPFKEKPKTNAPPTWVEPKLICEVRFSEWTKDGLMRQPIYMGLRQDKEPHQVRRERPLPTTQALERKRLINLDGQTEKIEIDGHEITLTNTGKVYFPEDVITKGEIIEYYRSMAPILLPYLVDRPQSLNRFPNGITGKHFFQKDVDQAPSWVKRVKIESESEPEGIDFVVCQDEATLVYLVNLGCIEINPWNSRLGHLENPDYMVIDLDPEERPFEDVIKVAQLVHKVLDEIGAENYVKTSGQTGLHIFIPLGAKYSYEQTRQFSNLISQLTNGILPDITSLVRSPKQRKGKIYLDFLQNSYGQTMAAPYSLRPKNGAPVSTPLSWDEVRTGLSPHQFNLKNIHQRIDQVGDLWKGVLGTGIHMEKSLKALEKSWKKIQEEYKS